MATRKSQRRSVEDIAPVSSPFAEFLAQIQAGKLPQTDALASAIAGVQSKLGEWRPSGEQDPFAFLFDQLNNVLEGVKSLAEKNLDENLNKIIQEGANLVTEGKRKAKSVTDAAKPEAAAIKDEAAEVVASAKSLSAQLLYSAEFRTFLVDCFDLVRDAAGIAADKAKEATIAGVDAAADATKEAVADTLSASSEDVKGKKRTRETSVRKATKKARELTTLAPEDRTRLRTKFESIARRANQNEALRNGFDSLARIARLMQSALHKGKRKAANAAADFDTTPIKNAWEETKKMLDKFGISGEPLESFSADVWTFYTEISNSKPLSDLFGEIYAVASDAIKNPSILTEAAFGTRFEGLTDRFRAAWADLKDADAFPRAYDALSSFIANIGTNPALAIANKAQSMLGTTFFDERGNFVLKTEMMGKLREMFVKLLVAQLKSLPMPKVEGSNDTYDYAFEEMSLNLADLLPDQLHLTVKNDMDINVASASAQDVRGKLALTATNIKPSLTNVKFWFKRKGLVSIEDRGTADVHLTGEGATITIRLDMDVNEYKAQKQIFRVTDVFCVIDNLKIIVVEAEKHETLLSWLAPIISSRVKNLLEERIVISLRDSIERIEEGMAKLIDLAPSLETIKEGVQLAANPISQGVPAAVSLITGAGGSEKTTQG